MPLALRTSSRAVFLFLAVSVLQSLLLLLSTSTCVVAEDTDAFSNTNIKNDTNSNSNSNNQAGIDWRNWLFSFFRYGLFFFIIFFPCFRGLKVWFQAGGRIVFRRTGDNTNNNRDTNNNNNRDNNEESNGNNNNNTNNNANRGWIIGLRYQPADLDRWLILSGYGSRQVPEGGVGTMFPGSGNNGNNRKLTEEEVYALPEIRAPKPSSDGDIDGDGDGDIELGTLGDNNNDDELAATYHGIRIKNKHESSDLNNASSDASVEATDESPEQPQPSTVAATTTPTTTERLFTTTMSTVCSICIEDFEEGEMIRLLPRCGHAFHTECILPWLTEKQGCCPTCKALVICPEVAVAGEEAKENEDENEHRLYPLSFTTSNININSNNENIQYFVRRGY